MRLISTVLGLSLAFCANAEGDRAILVLDASGSMWGQIDGKTKIEIARETIAGVTAQWPAGSEIGLVAYGHRNKGDCADIETLIEPAALDRNAFLGRVNALSPKGMTPISDSVRQAAQALRFTESKATVILVSDGEETCNADPCAVGAELEKLGVDFTAHVIGFDIGNPVHQAQLRCLAENTGGRYFNASDARELSGALSAAVTASTEPPPPPATASLDAPASASITSEIEIRWEGPADQGDYIAIMAPGAQDMDYVTYTSRLEPGQAARLTVPAEHGPYEIRYVSPLREKPVLARRPLTVSDLEASIQGPATAVAGSTIQIRARGPVGPGHWIGFAPAGSEAGSFVSGYYVRITQPQTETALNVPGQAGDYELRYVLNEAERVVASQPITVTAATALVKGPATAMAGDRVVVEANGPADARNWIGFAPADGDDGAYVGGSYARPEGPSSRLTIEAPADPGAYELRYVINEGESVAARQKIQVTPAVAQLRAPESAPAGSQLTVEFDGPRGSGHWIGLVARGDAFGNYKTYASVQESGPASLGLPHETGDYDLVFVLSGTSDGDAEIARKPLRITGP